MAQERGFRPTIELLLAPELVAAAQANPVLTPSQLHVLQQQIAALRRINVQLRVLKSRARTGAEPTAPRVPSGGGRGRGRGRGRAAYEGGMIVLSGGGRGRGRGRGRGKRGREDESEEDDSIVARSSEEEEEEAAVGSDSSEEEGMLSDEYESADSSESEDDYSLPAVAQPRRTGRMRRPSSAASLLTDALRSEGGEDGGSSSGEEEVGGQQEQQQQRGAPEQAGPDEEQQGAAAPAKQDKGKEAPTSSGSAKRRGLFMVVSEDTTSASGAIHLPQLKPVKPPKPGRAAAAGEEEGDTPVELEEGAERKGEEEDQEEEEVACDVCGDAEAVEGNVILLCEGKGCNVAVHQQCYGVHKVPEGKWLCEACRAKLKPGAAHCCVCPVVGGAVKKVASLGRVVPASSSSSGAKGKGGSKGAPPVFCHLACALWVPEIEFADHEHMAGVRLDRMTRVRAKLRCEICKQAGGAAVQCAFGTCCRSFHVLCGRAAGQQLTFRATDGEPLAFCKLHSRPAFEKMVEEYVDGKRSLELRGQPADGEDGEGGAADSGG